MAQPGLAGWVAQCLMDSPLVPLFVIASLMLGGYGLLVTPREDRPDIDVPTAMVLIPWPGGGTQQVDEQLARRAGTWIRQLSSVTEVRSSSTENAALLIVEFEPGTAESKAYAELQEIFAANAGLLPLAAGPARVETFGEQRLGMFVANLDSKTRSPGELEQIAAELAARLESVPGVRNISLHGGEKRAVEILPRPEDLAAHGIHLKQLAQAISAVARSLPVGILEGKPVTAVQAGTDIGNRAVLARIPVGQGVAGPVHLEDVADIRDGSELRNQAVLHWRRDQSVAYPSVSLAVTTLAGKNVSDVTQDFRDRMEDLQADLIPSDVHLTTVYDAGKDATERVYSVLRQLLTGTIVVVLIIGIGLGWRAGLIIAMMMPTSLAVVPYFYHSFGFSLNPVSIAAMILAIGILSDDAVVMLENISRQFHKAGKKSRELTVTAVKEVGNPTILADILVVATLLPTAFITGEMGQYVRAIPVGASVAVLFSLLIALSITPYYGYRLLRVSDVRRSKRNNNDRQDSTFAAIYRSVIGPFLNHSLLRWGLYLVLALLFLASLSLIGLRLVQVGLTPNLDRQVFAVNLELPVGSTLTDTLAAATAVNQQLRQFEEVKSLTVYAGTDAPLISPHAEIPVPSAMPPHRADIHVELVPEEDRQRLSYQVSREILREIDDWLIPFQAKGYIDRIPSGPSNDRDITAEIYGPDAASRQALADQVEQWLGEQPSVLATQQIPRPALDLLNISVDPQRAAVHGVVPAEITRTLLLAIEGQTVADLPDLISRNPVPVVLRLDEQRRNNARALKALYVPSAKGKPVPLADLVDFKEEPGQPVRLRRDLLPMINVVADLDQSMAQPLTVQLEALAGLEAGDGSKQVKMDWLSPPDQTEEARLYWSGKWEMTRDVYLDLGLAGVVVMLIIYVLMAGWFGSYTLPFLIMLPIPLVFIGVVPAHWLWGINIAGTGVLGIIALAGIVTRNSILLVDFIRQHRRDGMNLGEAVVQAGVQRTRPIVLTAATVMFGSGVLIFEPSLEPLGLTLASGVLIAVPITLILIPVMYFHAHD